MIPKASPTIGSSYAKMNKFQNVEKEILKLKMTFQAKQEATDKQMANMQENLNYHQTRLDYQEQKMEMMENEINKLKETVSGQKKIITDLKYSKIEIENKLKSEIYQQNEEIRSLKLNNTMKHKEMSVTAMDKHSPDELSQVKPNSDNVDNTDAANGTLIGKQTINKIEIYRDKEIGGGANKQPGKINNLKSSLSTRKMTRLTKRQVSGEIAFSAYLSYIIPHLAPGHTIKYDQIIINDGNAYNHYTGIFTVPTTGVYLLTFHFDVQDNRKEGIKLVVNNRNIVDAVASGLSGYGNNMGGKTAIIKLIQGEKVWLESYDSADGEILSTTSYKLTTFAGVLLYQ